MRLLFFICIFYSNSLFSQSGIYNLQITTSTGDNINLSQYTGRKMVIAPFSVDSLITSNMSGYLDSLQSANPAIVLIIIPAKESDLTPDSLALENLRQSLSDNIILARAAYVKKDMGTDQETVMQWLTDSSKNFHFDNDVESDTSLYLVSGSGVLYAVLDKQMPQQLFDDLLNQPDVTQ